jgi:hypothetical protein
MKIGGTIHFAVGAGFLNARQSKSVCIGICYATWLNKRSVKENFTGTAKPQFHEHTVFSPRRLSPHLHWRAAQVSAPLTCGMPCQGFCRNAEYRLLARSGRAAGRSENQLDADAGLIHAREWSEPDHSAFLIIRNRLFLAIKQSP